MPMFATKKAKTKKKNQRSHATTHAKKPFAQLPDTQRGADIAAHAGSVRFPLRYS